MVYMNYSPNPTNIYGHATVLLIVSLPDSVFVKAPVYGCQYKEALNWAQVKFISLVRLLYYAALV